MERNQFWEYYNNYEFDKIKSIFGDGRLSEYGFDIATHTRQASWSHDFKRLYFLWQQGALAETPYIEQVFARFRNGEIAADLTAEMVAAKAKETASVKFDLTDYKSADQIPIEACSFDRDDTGVVSLYVRFAPFMYEGDVQRPEWCQFSDLNFDGFDGTNRFDFSGHNFDQSLYLFHAHNPVDLLEVAFSSVFDTEVSVKITLQFDFAFEAVGKREKRIIEVTERRSIFEP
jgi:hypothetical protein